MADRQPNTKKDPPGKRVLTTSLHNGRGAEAIRIPSGLQDIGYIKYIRGRISVIDRAGLEGAACDCYHIVKREYDREYV